MHTLLNALSLLNSLCLVDLSTLFFNTGLLVINININNIILVELLSPPLRDSILHLILQLFSIWALGKCLTGGLLMKLIKLIVEFGNHFLNVLSLFLLVNLVDNSLFNISLSVTGDDFATRAYDQLCLYL